MKTTGITRRIDELGRIVIPKEIRKNMHLKTGELLEIFLSDSETITLKKHSIITRGEEFISFYIKALASKINASVYMTNLSEIVFSNDESVIGEKISSKLEEQIFNNLSANNLTKLVITNKIVIEKPFSIYPLSPNGDLSGVLIIKFKDDNKFENQEIIKFSTVFLESYFENN